MLYPYAAPEDVAGIWRPLSDEETAVASAWIDQASQQIRDEVPDIGGLDVDERLAAGMLSVDTVRYVVARMVRRVLMNPEGARSRAQGIDNYTESVTVDSTLSHGELFINERELKRLMGIRLGKGQAFSFETAPDSPIVVWPHPMVNGFSGWSSGWY